jgi:hypothetical protein
MLPEWAIRMTTVLVFFVGLACRLWYRGHIAPDL